MSESEHRDREETPSEFPVKKKDQPPITPETEEKVKKGLDRELEEEKQRRGK